MDRISERDLSGQEAGMAETLREFALWYVDIFRTAEGRIGFTTVAFIISLWIAGIKEMRANKKAMAEEKKRKEDLDMFN